MNLHGDFAHPDFGCDLLVQETRRYEGNDLALTNCQGRIAFAKLRCRLILFPARAVAIKPYANRVKQVLVAKRLGQELDRSAFHRSYGHRNIAMASNEYDRNIGGGVGEFCLEIQTADTWQADVEDQATRRIGEFV